MVLLLAMLVLLVGAARADAATVLGSPEPTGPPDAFAGGTGFRQIALQGATLEAEEPGVLVSARGYVKRLNGAAQPMIVVLRPTEGIQAAVVAAAPLPASSAAGALVEVRNLHLPVESGDFLGLMLPAGQVEAGVRRLPGPDGAIVKLAAPCAPCGTDGGTGVELLLQGTVEPDFDEDLLGDETQDPDRGGEIVDEEFEDEEFEDEFDDEDEDDAGPNRRRRGVRLLRVTRNRGGGATLLLATPRAGRLAASATARRRTIAAGRARTRRAGRVKLRLRPRPAARRMLSRRAVRTRLVIRFRGRKAMTRRLTLRMR